MEEPFMLPNPRVIRTKAEVRDGVEYHYTMGDNYQQIWNAVFANFYHDGIESAINDANNAVAYLMLYCKPNENGVGFQVKEKV